MSREKRQESRYRNLGHWAAFYAALVGAGRTPALAVALADEALAELLSAVPQLAQPAPIEPHGAPEFPTEQPSEAAPDSLTVNEESASSPRPHPAAISQLIAAARAAEVTLTESFEEGLSMLEVNSLVERLRNALKPFVDDDIIQPDTAVS